MTVQLIFMFQFQLSSLNQLDFMYLKKQNATQIKQRQQTIKLEGVTVWPSN